MPKPRRKNGEQKPQKWREKEDRARHGYLGDKGRPEPKPQTKNGKDKK